MIWGLIPVYASHEKPDHYAVFNKRIESFTNTGAYFNRLAANQRCLVILDGFYEWKLIAGKKQPYYVSLKDGKPLQMAGIWDNFKNQYEDERRRQITKTFSILTGEPSARFKEVHNRQPVFLTDEQAMEWLDPNTAIPSLLEILKTNPTHAELEINNTLQFYPVDTKMTNPRYQGEDCSQPISLGANMTSFFKKVPPVTSETGHQIHQEESQEKSSARHISWIESKQEEEEVPTTKQKQTKGEKRKLDEVDLTTEDSPVKLKKAEQEDIVLKKPKHSTPQKPKLVLKSPNKEEGIAKFFLKK
jgi:putative SOS response-associated peptidase YedK